MEQSQVKVTGSIKFDIHVDKQKQIEGQQLRQSIGEQRPVWVAASTHKGEDETLLEAHKKIAQQFPDALLIIVPRHPERFEEVYELIIKCGFSCEKRTAQGQLDDIQVYLGDTMGEMMTLLEAADICFMGGSLLGDKVGGHNLLEPAALSKALMIGPSYFNFSTITDMLLANKAVQIVGSESEIAKQVLYWFHNPVSANQAGERAQQVVEQNRGALSKTLNEIAR
jgi:3-deoxy-D-manno-octulosonic-acid transferase